MVAEGFVEGGGTQGEDLGPRGEAWVEEVLRQGERARHGEHVHGGGGLVPFPSMEDGDCPSVDSLRSLRNF